MHNLEYKAEPLPNITRADLNAGKELIDVGACCPTIFTTGNLVNFAKSKLAVEGKQHVLDNYVFMTAGACGPCLFGQYHESYSMALDGLGLRDFRMFLLAQDQLDQSAGAGRGIEINLKLSTGIIWAILCADVLSDLEYMTRPYEVNAGQTAKVLSESIEYMYDVFRRRPLRFEKWGVLAWHVLTDYFTGALREVRKKWEAIRVDRLQVKPKIKITGEFWLQTHEGDGNYSIKRWLEQEGAEVVPPPIAVWLHYLLYQPIFRAERQQHVDKHARFKILLLKGLEKIYLGTYNGFRKALGNIPSELPDQEELRRLSSTTSRSIPTPLFGAS
jgi:predicted nucleotide-binding protein (sugar kinase/HSP70/actin superfamily)